MLIEVWHFSPVKGLCFLEPKIPQNKEYADHKGVYLAPSKEWCFFWAKAMAAEGYWKPPFYIYRGFVPLENLRKLRSVDDDCEIFELVPVARSELSEIDQVISVCSVAVDFIEVLENCEDQCDRP